MMLTPSVIKLHTAVGLTAFSGWKEFSKAKKGETAFVTAASGPVGSLVAQFAKQDGLKVIATAGSEEKVQFVKDLGVDVVFNYRRTNTQDLLAREGPIDIYWDNVGGEMLDVALKHSKSFARFIECGMISGYNKAAKPIENIRYVLERQLSVNGFIVLNLGDKYEEEFYATVPQKLAKKELKHKEEVTEGLDMVGNVLLALQRGENKGKPIILVAKE